MNSNELIAANRLTWLLMLAINGKDTIGVKSQKICLTYTNIGLSYDKYIKVLSLVLIPINLFLIDV